MFTPSFLATRPSLFRCVLAQGCRAGFLPFCPAYRDTRVAVALYSPARRRESSPRLSPGLLAQPWLPPPHTKTRRTSFRSRSTHATLAHHPKHGIPGHDMTRGTGGESTRLLDKWTDLEGLSLGCFCPFRDTVLQKWPKRVSQQVSNRSGVGGVGGVGEVLGRPLRDNLP